MAPRPDRDRRPTSDPARGHIALVLQGYADRGLFRGFLERAARNGGAEFRFAWLNEGPMTVTWEPERRRLQFKDLLPDMAARSSLYAALKTFLRERSDAALPEHRRIDPAKAKVTCANRRGRLSVGLTIAGDHHRYGANKLVNLVHELFLFLHASWPDYMHANFKHPLE